MQTSTGQQNMKQNKSTTKVPVTACIITFNEAHQIQDCLDTLSFCQDIVVVDSHSNDETTSIAKQVTEKVLSRDWPGHIDQKNFAIDNSETDWVLCIDADERVTDELRDDILQVFKDGPKHAGYELSRRTFYLGQFIDHGGFYPDRKMRLFRRSQGRWGGTNPHDHVFLEKGCSQGTLKGDLHHHSYKNIADHLKTIDYFTTIAAKEKLSKGKSKVLLSLLFGPPWKFVKMFVLQRGFLDGIAGLIVAFLGAFYVMLKYAKLWELIHVEKQSPAAMADVTYGRRGESG
ncbi:MAG: glycosyltransferase family 2 protein, partial [Planctomycetota bacterium]|nr:glycosyltransferase family 2 protein [Planctomycetota bacterium]